MAKFKDFITSMLCALASISANPVTDYRRHIPVSSDEIMKVAWLKTGSVLQKTVEEVGVIAQ